MPFDKQDKPSTFLEETSDKLRKTVAAEKVDVKETATEDTTKAAAEKAAAEKVIAEKATAEKAAAEKAAAEKAAAEKAAAEVKQAAATVKKFTADLFGRRPRFVHPADDSSECNHIRANILNAGENIILYTRNFGEYNIVLLTETRFLKVEKGKVVSNVNLGDVVEIYQEKNGVLRWDKVCTVLRAGGKETFGVSSKDAAEFFVNALRHCVG